jgi:hypothetical protein
VSISLEFVSKGNERLHVALAPDDLDNDIQLDLPALFNFDERLGICRWRSRDLYCIVG